MRITIKSFGDPSVLVVENFNKPKPDKNQVLIKVLAAGVNPVEAYRRAGNYAVLPKLPWTPGQDGAGIIEEVGDGVDEHLKPGTRVWTSSSITGTYAQYAISHQVHVHVLPESLSFEQGAALWTSYGTAYHALFQIGQPNLAGPNIILVHGASGGVGTACIQLAKRIPNTIVMGTAGTQEGCEKVLKLGADYAFNHKEEDYMEKILERTNGKGVDIVLEMLANVNLGKDLKILTLRGRVVVIGSRGPVEILPRDLMGKRAEVRGVALANATPDEIMAIIKGIKEGTNEGYIIPLVGKTYHLKEAPQSHTDIMDASVPSSGKLILLPWGGEEESKK